MKKLNIKSSFVWRMIIILVLAILVSTSFVFMLSAKYKSGGQGGGDASGAKFNVTSGGTLTESFSATLLPGENIDKTITITNSSEVTVKYTVTVSSTGNLPLTYSWTEKTGQLDYNGTFTDTLNISWHDDSNDAKYSGRVELITVTVICEQVD